MGFLTHFRKLGKEYYQAWIPKDEGYLVDLAIAAGFPKTTEYDFVWRTLYIRAECAEMTAQEQWGQRQRR